MLYCKRLTDKINWGEGVFHVVVKNSELFVYDHDIIFDQIPTYFNLKNFTHLCELNSMVSHCILALSSITGDLQMLYFAGSHYFYMHVIIIIIM